MIACDAADSDAAGSASNRQGFGERGTSKRWSAPTDAGLRAMVALRIYDEANIDNRAARGYPPGFAIETRWRRRRSPTPWRR